VMGRGIGGMQVFPEDEHRERFLHFVGQMVERRLEPVRTGGVPEDPGPCGPPQDGSVSVRRCPSLHLIRLQNPCLGGIFARVTRRE